MGIENKDGALYWATGIDNSGLQSGADQSLGIIRGLMRQVSGFDVFAGLAASSGIAFKRVLVDAKQFSREYEQIMLEIKTISKALQDDYQGFSNQILSLSQKVPQSASELAQAMYEIVSSGYDGAAGMKLLEVSAKAAVGGVTDVATAADGLTTVLNSWKLEATESTRVADIFFQAVNLGKVTFGELASNIAQVAPLAAASGVSFEEVAAAVATLTKQGTPASQAVTQIRSAMVALNEQLGSGWGNTKTLNEGFQTLLDISKKTGKELNEVTGRVEGALAVLATTGKNAAGAAEDFRIIASAAGDAQKAFETMIEAEANQSKLLKNNIDAALKPIGDFLLSKKRDFAKFLNEAFDSGKVEIWAQTISTALKALLAFVATYKSLSVAQLAANGALGATSKLISGINLLIKSNPFGFLAAGLAALAVALSKAKREVNLFSELYKDIDRDVRGRYDEEISGLQKLSVELDLAMRGKKDYSGIIKEIDSKYGTHLGNLDSEADKYKAIKEAIEEVMLATQRRIELEILQEKAKKVKAEMMEIEDTWDKVIEGIDISKTLSDKDIRELNKRAKDALNEIFGGSMNVPVNAMQKNRYKQLFQILKDQGEEFKTEYEKILSDIKKIEEGILTGKKPSGGGGDGDGDGVKTYYSDLKKKIEEAEAALLSLANTKEKMDHALILNKRTELESYRREMEYLELILGIRTEITEEAQTLLDIEKQVVETFDQLVGKKRDADNKSFEKELLGSMSIMDKTSERYETPYQKYRKEIRQLEIAYKNLRTTMSDPLLDDRFNELSSKLKADLSASVFTDIGRGMQEISTIIGEIDEKAGRALSSIANMSIGASNILSGFASSDPAAMISGIASVIQSLMTTFSDLGGDSERYKATLKEINKELAQQQRLLEQSKRTGGTDQAYQSQIDTLERKRKETEDLISEYEKKAKNAKAWGMWHRYEKITEEAEKYKEELVEINNEIEDLGQEFSDFLAGAITEADIADKIAQAFQEGKASVADFAVFTTEIMRDAVLEVFKSSILGKEISAAKDYLAKALEDKKLSDSEIAEFERLMGLAREDSKKLWDQLQGSKIFTDQKETQESNSLSGAIRRNLTEETGSLLAGTMNAMRLDLRELVNMQLQALSHMEEISSNTSHNKRLQSIDANLELLKNNLTNNS